MSAAASATRSPGLPLARTTVEDGAKPPDLRKCWTLSYIKYNALKQTVLYFKDEMTTDEAVLRAKNYCKSKGYSFSWMEPTIVEL